MFDQSACKRPVGHREERKGGSRFSVLRFSGDRASACSRLGRSSRNRRFCWLAALPIVLALLGLSGCGGDATSGSGKTIAQQQTVNQLTIGLERPEQPRLLTEQPLTITLTDTRGAPVDGAVVWIGMVMPTMQMSPNEPDAVAAGNGRYRASVLYTMSGTWNLEVHATVKGQEYIATFHTPTA
jgi:hypothetical protein